MQEKPNTTRDVPLARVAQTSRGQEEERVKSYGSCTCLLPFMNQQVISMTITGTPSVIGFGIIVRETSLYTNAELHFVPLAQFDSINVPGLEAVKAMSIISRGNCTRERSCRKARVLETQ